MTDPRRHDPVRRQAVIERIVLVVITAIVVYIGVYGLFWLFDMMAGARV